MKKVVAIIAVLLLLIGLGYGAGIGYYADRFQANTKFGAVDISNMTFEQAKAKIESDIHSKNITIVENGKEIGKLSISDLKPQLNTDAALKKTYHSQDPVKWIMGFFSTDTHQHELMESMKIDEKALTEQLGAIGLGNAQRIAAEDAKIDYANDKGYFVQPEKMGNQLDLEIVKKSIIEGLQTGVTTTEVNTAYLQPEITSTHESITKVMNQIDHIASTKITLQIAGEEEVIPREKIVEWLYFDDVNDLVVDQTKVVEYVSTLNDKYATYNKPRQFQSTLQGTVTVQPGTLGWSIDSDEESSQIIRDLTKGGEIKRETYVVGSGYGQSGNDIGNSYVEVDVANQMMFIYVDGQQVLSTPIVTGRPGTDTVVGAYAVWDKKTPSVLKGFNPHTNKEYEQPVDYWMPFDATGQGIHDASWQASFGGEAHLSSGSLGCINTPPHIMPQVFEYVQLGMPVIVF